MIKFNNTFFGEIKDGKLEIENISDWSSRIHKFEGEKVMIKLDKRRKPRSLPQNSYFHLLCEMLADETGYTPAEMKAIVKWNFKIPHTSDLSTVEFETLCKDIRMWAGVDLGIYLPTPNEEIPNYNI